jgi:hypothetical protein
MRLLPGIADSLTTPMPQSKAAIYNYILNFQESQKLIIKYPPAPARTGPSYVATDGKGGGGLNRIHSEHNAILYYLTSQGAYK